MRLDGWGGGERDVRLSGWGKRGDASGWGRGVVRLVGGGRELG